MVLENHRFHEILGEMAACPYLEASLSRLLLDQSRMDLLALRLNDPNTQMARCLEWQGALVDAFSDRDEERVAELIRGFWR
ncbi:FCD domain protein [compost metagenome]